MRLKKSHSLVSSEESLQTDHSMEQPPFLGLKPKFIKSIEIVGALTRAGEAACGICTEWKARAVKFCVTCPSYYCEPHVRPHYTLSTLRRHILQDVHESLPEPLESVPQKRAKLVSPALRKVNEFPATLPLAVKFETPSGDSEDKTKREEALRRRKKEEKKKMEMRAREFREEEERKRVESVWRVKGVEKKKKEDEEELERKRGRSRTEREEREREICTDIEKLQ